MIRIKKHGFPVSLDIRPVDNLADCGTSLANIPHFAGFNRGCPAT
jgi:hypothetical protein